MAQPQTQPFTRGQVLDRSRGEYRSRCWPAPVNHWTVEVKFDDGNAAVKAGDYTFNINGPGGPFTITYTATAQDTLTTIAAGLVTKVQAQLGALRLASPSSSAGVVDLAARSAEVEFDITGATAPADMLLVATDETDTSDELQLGIAVALDDTDGGSIRTLVNADTAASVFGVTVEGNDLKPNTGNYKQDDVYEVGAQARIIVKGEVPVQVEEAITSLNDPVYIRKNATGTEVAGAFRKSTDSTDTVQLTNCRWLSLSYPDQQGRLTAMLLVNFQ